MSKYLLRDLDSGLDSLASNDKVLIMKKGTNASGSIDIDVNTEFREGAVVYAAQFKPITVTNGVATVTSAVVANGETVTMFLCNQNDLQYTGGKM